MESEKIFNTIVIDLMSYKMSMIPQIQNKIYHYLIKRINDKRVEGVLKLSQTQEKSLYQIYTT